jgi:hypothetical protein
MTVVEECGGGEGSATWRQLAGCHDVDSGRGWWRQTAADGRQGGGGRAWWRGGRHDVATGCHRISRQQSRVDTWLWWRGDGGGARQTRGKVAGALPRPQVVNGRGRRRQAAKGGGDGQKRGGSESEMEEM